MTFAASLALPRRLTLEPIARKIEQFRAARAQHSKYLALLDELQNMSNRDWDDIGLSRLNAHEIARQTVYGR
ncbi:uncharacterized protein DUF1127 [Rhodobacter sp. JA431]|uniref:DUF1127 domain-containing protein n=1 Tax=Rhodobacter sp. JA431 TaxID=570013 RepID=UPI000BD5D0F1|nr:DUF1127 domain-containing protein [Rhodobacter sp. JA431]SOC17129.1 uncharacterized protein DUF1127 [Rhodobacter sp. JA431]